MRIYTLVVYYADVGTNVFVSALLSERAYAATVRVLEAIFDGKIVPTRLPWRRETMMPIW